MKYPKYDGGLFSVSDLKTLYDDLIAEGATDDTPLFASSDAEGNSYHYGVYAGFDRRVDFEVYPWGSDDFETEGGTVIFSPGGARAEVIWAEDDE